LISCTKKKKEEGQKFGRPIKLWIQFLQVVHFIRD